MRFRSEVALSLVITYVCICSAWQLNQQVNVPGAPLLSTSISGFGASIAADGDFALVGASATSDGNGFAFVLQRAVNGDWSFMQPFSRPAGDLFNQARFGHAVAVSGPYAMISAPGHLGGNGCVRVYNTSGVASQDWRFWKQINAPLGATAAQFGRSIAMTDSLAAVGAPGSSSSDGTVLIYERETLATGIAVTTVSKADISSLSDSRGAQLGAAVAFFGENMVVASAPSRGVIVSILLGDGGKNKGVRVEVLPAPPRDLVGVSLAVGATFLAVGAPGVDQGLGAADAGTCFTYTRTGSTLSKSTDLLSVSKAGHRIGTSVSAFESTVAVGALGTKGAGGETVGSVSFFSRDELLVWSGQGSVGNIAAGFGVAVGMVSENEVLVGASGAQSGVGAVFVYKRTIRPVDTPEPSPATMMTLASNTTTSTTTTTTTTTPTPATAKSTAATSPTSPPSPPTGTSSTSTRSIGGTTTTPATFSPSPIPIPVTEATSPPAEVDGDSSLLLGVPLWVLFAVVGGVLLCFLLLACALVIFCRRRKRHRRRPGRRSGTYPDGGHSSARRGHSRPSSKRMSSLAMPMRAPRQTLPSSSATPVTVSPSARRMSSVQRPQYDSVPPLYVNVADLRKGGGDTYDAISSPL